MVKTLVHIFFNGEDGKLIVLLKSWLIKVKQIDREGEFYKEVE
jgi:hypothetical protein